MALLNVLLGLRTDVRTYLSECRLVRKIAMPQRAVDYAIRLKLKLSGGYGSVALCTAGGGKGCGTRQECEMGSLELSMIRLVVVVVVVGGG